MSDVLARARAALAASRKMDGARDYPPAAAALIRDLAAVVERQAEGDWVLLSRTLHNAETQRDAARADIARLRAVADEWERRRPGGDTTVFEAHVWNTAGIHVRRVLDGEP